MVTLKKVFKLGDILKIPVGSERYAVGQVILQPDDDFEYIVVFDLFVGVETTITFHDIANADVLFLTQVSGGINAIPKRGKWDFAGNLSLRNDLHIPEFKVRTRDGWAITNWKREILRPATLDEITNLNLQEAYSSPAIESVLRAYLGKEEPNIFYNKLFRKTRTD